MVHKLTVGLTQKIGQPNFGSVGASCCLEVQLSDSEAEQPELVSIRIKQAFARCRQSIADELSTHAIEHEPVIFEPAHQPSPPTRSSGQKLRPATDAQIRAIHAITAKSGIVLARELENQFGVHSPQQLSIRQASQLIDSIKEIPTIAAS